MLSHCFTGQATPWNRTQEESGEETKILDSLIVYQSQLVAAQFILKNDAESNFFKKYNPPIFFLSSSIASVNCRPILLCWVANVLVNLDCLYSKTELHQALYDRSVPCLANNIDLVLLALCHSRLGAKKRFSLALFIWILFISIRIACQFELVCLMGTRWVCLLTSNSPRCRCSCQLSSCIKHKVGKSHVSEQVVTLQLPAYLINFWTLPSLAFSWA